MLTKAFRRVFIQGSPEIPESPGGYVCYTPPSSGYWTQECHEVDIPLGSGIPVPFGSTPIIVKDAQGQIIRVYCIVCTSTWVSTGPQQPPTCYYVEPTAYRPSVPNHIEQQPIIGWNGGANSEQEREHDYEAKWTMEFVTGVYVGITTDLGNIDDTTRYAHAFYFHQSANRKLFRIVENGKSRSHDIEYSIGDEFRIRRIGNVVTYWHGDQFLYASGAPLGGMVNVGSTLYASGDRIP